MAIREERTDAELSTVLTYCDEIGELYAEDVISTWRSCQKVVTSAAEMSLEDIQVGELGEPLSNN